VGGVLIEGTKMLYTFLGVALSLFCQSRLPLVKGYEKYSSIASVHATQAAAADKDFAYAISNSKVAQYDRKNGQLIRLSEGPAQHLNSGWVWQGKVFCAHSNYPNKPEESDIRVYHPATGKLSIHHAFVNPPGSLTWCLRDPMDKYWWCCFAHYQKDNSKTILVRMDDNFRELQRWTFPEKVIADWDNASASGGIWDGETLLVTHHHFKVLYRLKIPNDGKVLELVEALECPFPGQGIALDPLNGELVGIDRPKKEIVFARKSK
jgi:uncharacterized protein YhbP (UPF0306 family)